MNFLGTFKNLVQQQDEEPLFSWLVGYDDLKDNVVRAVESEYNVNMLFAGPPGTAKTLIGEELERKKLAVRFDATTLSGKGFIQTVAAMKDKLKGKVIFIDEIDKLPKNQLAMLLSLLVNGEVKYNTDKLKLDFKLECKVFATCNSTAKLSKPILSRFDVYALKEYTFEEFTAVAVNLLARKYKIPSETSVMISKIIWFDLGCHDVRKLLSVGKLIKITDTAEAIQKVIQTMMKYQSDGSEEFN